MKKTLKICTFNVKNDNIGKKVTEKDLKNDYSFLLNKQNIDILATQEMISETLKILEKDFREYHFIGKSRYGSGIIQERIKTLKKYNEYTTIITKFPILKEKTINLPWLPMNIKDLYFGIFKYHSVTPRVMTDALIELESGTLVRFLNTHLDCHMNTVRKRQLNYIFNYIKKSNLPVILVGDFNTNLNNKLFINFIKKLDSIGIKRIEYDHKTFHKSKKDTPIDYIFIPKEYKVIDFGIINQKQLKEYSDHYPLYVTIELEDK